MTRALTLLDGTADVTYCANVTFFLHATSGGLSLTAAFSLRRFLAFYCFKCYLASFSRYKTVLLPNIMPPKHAEQDQIDAKWLGKKLVFQRESQRVRRGLIIENKSIKNPQNLIFFFFFFFQCKIEFYFTHENQNLYSHSWLPPLVKILHLVFLWCENFKFAKGNLD